MGVRVCVHVPVRMFSHTHVHISACLRAHVCEYVRVSVCVCVCSSSFSWPKRDAEVRGKKKEKVERGEQTQGFRELLVSSLGGTF